MYHEIYGYGAFHIKMKCQVFDFIYIFGYSTRLVVLNNGVLNIFAKFLMILILLTIEFFPNFLTR